MFFISLPKREKEVVHRSIGPIRTVPGIINVLLYRIRVWKGSLEIVFSSTLHREVS